MDWQIKIQKNGQTNQVSQDAILGGLSLGKLEATTGGHDKR